MPRPVLAFVLALLAAPAWAAPALTVPALDGFGGLKFGMTPDQARAAPGQSFGPFHAKDLFNRDRGAMASKIRVPAFGQPYTMDVYFYAPQKLTGIYLGNEKMDSRPGCEATFLALLARLEKRYGNFLPVYPQHQKNDQDQLPIAIEWKHSAGASRYQLATVWLGEETAYVWDARIVINGSYVDAATIWSAPHDDDQSTCLTTITYQA